ncbi:MAG TPA: DNA primase [Solirubrobacteraceae bacterium]|nr:DNA primase [Solirubrobacteraceae bacterium]
MARYTQESREKVRDAIDFAELVGARTELKRSGTNRLQGLCPFHEERTPSFGIDPVEKLYHCFGCGAGGDVFSFVMETEGLDFGAALEWLAERANVELERESEDPRDAARRVRRDRLLALLERTAAYYVRVLWESGEASRAREYLLGRGLDEGTLREFRVGYSPSRWDRVLMASRKAGYTEEELLTAGLASRSRDGSGLFDRFRGRIMFPLADERGRVLGFGARALGEGQQPKYLNTSDGEVFHKGRIVYGADLARAAAAKAGRVVLVEGYTDVIALRQAGVPESVCSMGTALTPQQVDALARLAPKVLFCQDPDAAGQKAIGRGLEELAEHNSDRRMGTKVDFRIVRLPAGQDPADVVRADGGDAMRRLLDAAVAVPHYQVEMALEGDLTGTDARDAALSLAAEAIAPLGPSVLRSELVKLVSDRLNVPATLVESVIADPGRRRRAAQAAETAAAERRKREQAAAARRGAAGGRGSAAAPGAAGSGSAGPGGGTGHGGFAGDGGPAPWDDAPVVYDDPGPEEGLRGPNGAHKVLDRREQTERAFLSYCLALPAEGEQRLAEADLEELFSAPMTRRAAEYLRGRLRTPAAELPPGDEPLARLVAELVIRAGQLEATPAKLELEALQLDLSRLDRLIAGSRVSGGEGMRDLASKRQGVLDAIRHRLT